MGQYQHPNLGQKEFDLRRCANVLVGVSEDQLSALSSLISPDAFPGLTLVSARPDEDIDQSLLNQASLAVIEVDPANPRSLSRLSRLRDAKSPIPVIAAIPDASVALVRTLVREGVSDVISLPINPDELLDAALNVLASKSEAAPDDQGLAPVVAVVRSVGGCGATSLATQLAAELGERKSASGKPLIVDLDLQFGSVAEFMSAQGRGSIADLLDAGDRLDDELIASVARNTEDGVAVIAAPDEIIPLESVDADQLLKVIDQLRRNFGLVILDLPTDWTNWTLSVALAADVVLMVVELSVPSLRHAKRRLDLLQNTGIRRDHISIVVNRVERRLFRTIDLGDVANTLNYPVTASIALDEPSVSAAQDQGRLVTALHRKSRFGTDVGKLADAMLAGSLAAYK